MVKCKKHKPKNASAFGHHRAPKGDCQNCAFFSKQNCGQHAAANDTGFTA